MTQEKLATILIVDGLPENLSVLSELLHPQYRVLAANSGEGCLRVAAGQPKPDLILLDVFLSVYEGFVAIAENYRDAEHTE